MTTQQLAARNRQLDALTFHLRGFSLRWIAGRMGVTHQTVSRWIKRAKRDPKLIAFADRRVRELVRQLDQDRQMWEAELES